MEYQSSLLSVEVNSYEIFCGLIHMTLYKQSLIQEMSQAIYSENIDIYSTFCELRHNITNVFYVQGDN